MISEVNQLSQRVSRSDEFPKGASLWDPSVERREFLKLLGTTLALSGLSGCGRPASRIVPFVKGNEKIIPGKPLYFSTSFPFNGYAEGIIVETRMGRPIKVEGNPDHPASLGGTSPYSQAALWGIYDPARAKSFLKNGTVTTASRFRQDQLEWMEKHKKDQGATLRFLTPHTTSPTFMNQMKLILERFPRAKWIQYSPINYHQEAEGLELLTGKRLIPKYNFDQVQTVVSFDDDFFLTRPGHLRYARDFITLRQKALREKTLPPILHVLESFPKLTGAQSSKRHVVSPWDIPWIIQELAQGLGALKGIKNNAQKNNPSPYQQIISQLIHDLKKAGEKGVVLAGYHQPPLVHALAMAINHQLGAVGKTVELMDPGQRSLGPSGPQGLWELSEQMLASQVETLIMIDVDPLHSAPADMAFKEALQKVTHSVCLNNYENETSAHCTWFAPLAHFLEGWSDLAAYDGTVSIIQPLLRPLSTNVSLHEFLALWADQKERSSYELVRSHWKRELGLKSKDFAFKWRQILREGLVPNSAWTTSSRALPPNTLNRLGKKWAQSQDKLLSREKGEKIYLSFAPDPSVWDGEYAYNGWLQELPRPFTKITWDNVAHLSPALAKQYGLKNGDVVQITHQGQTLEIPAWILPGLHDWAILLHLGQGKYIRPLKKVIGHRASVLQTRNNFYHGEQVLLQKTDGHYPLAHTQDHFHLEGRSLYQTVEWENFQTAKGHLFPDEMVLPPSLYPEDPIPDNNPYAWGMTVDLNSCIGCNACVMACQVENNVPIVGREQVLRAREMHWLRVDVYYQEKEDPGQAHFQPVLCMHCEKAPCEVVCPVSATLHSESGLNQMIYNRCIGTRYCSNNCPYKVRRFNFLDFSKKEVGLIDLAKNPEVSIRTRGVMEKCTYCVQRISNTLLTADAEKKGVEDGDVVTACQAACPTRAITFGNIKDPKAQVTQLKKGSLNYGMLSELGTRPRTTYLARVLPPRSTNE